MNTCSMLHGSRPARWLQAVALALAVCAAPFSIAQPANDLGSLRQRAQGGDANAQLLLADKLHRGDGVARDDVEARALVLKAARQGNADAQRSLGFYYWRSYGGPQDKVEALKWILLAERNGNKDAPNVRANMLKSMSPEEVKEAQARAGAAPSIDVGKLRAAAEQGDPVAQAALGGALVFGRGVAPDAAEGIKWLRAAVARGDLTGITVLGAAYLEGKGVQRDRAEGTAMITRAAEQGFAPAQVALAGYYFRGEWIDRDDKAALYWARKGAEQGNKEGQRALAAHYLTGRGVAQDPVQGEQWLRKAAAQGDQPSMELLRMLGSLDDAAKSPESQVAFVRKVAESGDASGQYHLSRFYAEGSGVPKDKKLEVEWERKAAEQGHVEALGSYGWRLVVTHDGVKPDFWKGYGYLYRAGALGHVQSQRALGLLYQKGTGVKKDIVMSLIWLDAAARTGDARAKEMREAVLKEATAAQVAEADTRAAAWMKRPPIERTTPEGAP